jgi:hypothetical protein
MWADNRRVGNRPWYGASSTQCHGRPSSKEIHETRRSRKNHWQRRLLYIRKRTSRDSDRSRGRYVESGRSYGGHPHQQGDFPRKGRVTFRFIRASRHFHFLFSPAAILQHKQLIVTYGIPIRHRSSRFLCYGKRTADARNVSSMFARRRTCCVTKVINSVHI